MTNVKSNPETDTQEISNKVMVNIGQREILNKMCYKFITNNEVWKVLNDEWNKLDKECQKLFAEWDKILERN